MSISIAWRTARRTQAVTGCSSKPLRAAAVCFVPETIMIPRAGAKVAPAREDIPSEYAALLDWYRDWSQDSVEDKIKHDPLLALRGSGKELWADEHADEYVRRLREGWE